jgi:hypothetical protein
MHLLITQPSNKTPLSRGCPGLTNLWIDGAKNKLMFKSLAHAFGLLVFKFRECYNRLPKPPATGLPLLTSLSLKWPGMLRAPLAPLARLTRLTALELWGYVSGANKADWLPPNLEVLRLGAKSRPIKVLSSEMRGEVLQSCLYAEPCGIGGAGWLAALHAGACPRLRALHLTKLAVQDYNQEQGVMLANTLPRLTALELLEVTAYEYRMHDIDDRFDFDKFGPFSSDDDDYEPIVGDTAKGDPIPAAPLLAALPNLRHCRVVFVGPYLDADDKHEEQGDRSCSPYGYSKPMLLATPAELAALRAPRLESLAVGLVTSPAVEDKAWRCVGADETDSDDDEPHRGIDIAAQRGCAAGLAGYAPANTVADATAGAPAAASAGIGAGSGLPALRSLELHVGCNGQLHSGEWLWDLAALPPGSLPALRRLLVLPLWYACGSIQLPLDAVARAAPGLERLVIHPRCAGPLDALFCDGGCGALSMRSLAVLPSPPYDAGTPACIDNELRSGLRAREAAAQRAGGDAVPLIKVTFFGGPRWRAVLPDPHPRGATVARRPCLKADARYVAHFLHTGLRSGTLPSNAREDRYGVEAYERAQHA